MEKLSAIALLVPVLLPVMEVVAIDPIHFGVVMVLSLMFGILTPRLRRTSTCWKR